MDSYTTKQIKRDCAAKHRPRIDLNLDQNTIREIGYDFRVLPTFEKGIYEKAFIEYSPLKRNEKLNCHWKTFLDNIEGRVFAPFKFPSIRDLHIDKNFIRYMPSENHYLYNNRFSMRAGPYCDAAGQTPIPHELLYKREGKSCKKGAQKKNKDVSNAVKK